jgi:hypothetical protein
LMQAARLFWDRIRRLRVGIGLSSDPDIDRHSSLALDGFCVVAGDALEVGKYGSPERQAACHKWLFGGIEASRSDNKHPNRAASHTELMSSLRVLLVFFAM